MAPLLHLLTAGYGTKLPIRNVRSSVATQSGQDLLVLSITLREFAAEIIEHDSAIVH